MQIGKSFARSHVLSDSPHILIVRLSSMGDLLRFLPLANALKRRYPEAHVTWAVGSRCKDVVEMCVDVDEALVIGVDPVSPRRNWPGALLRFVPKLRNRRYDAAIDCHSAMLSAGIMILASASRRFGIDKPNLLNVKFFPYRAVEPQSATPVNYHLSVLRFFDIEVESLVPDVRLDPGADARRVVRGLIEAGKPAHRPLVVIHHDTSLDSKRWEAEKFSMLANRLQSETEAAVMVIGEHSSERFKAIRRLCEPNIVFHHGLSVRELAALFEACDLVIAHESGPLHLAAALSRPSVGIFGPSDLSINTPYGDMNHVVRRAVPCSPCFKGFDFFFSCPLRTMECLISLPVDDVFAAAAQMISRSRAGGRLVKDTSGTAATAR